MKKVSLLLLFIPLVSFGQKINDYKYVKILFNDYGVDIVTVATEIFTEKGFVVLESSGNKTLLPIDANTDHCDVLTCKVDYKRGITGFTRSILKLSLLDCNNNVVYKKTSKHTTNFNQPHVLNNFIKATNGIEPRTKQKKSPKPGEWKDDEKNKVYLPPPPDNPSFIAVVDFTGNNVSEGDCRALIDRLRAELFNTKHYKVIEREMMEEIIKEQGFQQSGCSTDECMVEVGKLIGVEKIVGGSISKVGRTYSVSSRIVSVETGKILKGATYDYKGEIDELLTTGMRMVAYELIK